MTVALALSAGAEPDGRGLGAIREYAAGQDGERRATAEFLIEHLPLADRETAVGIVVSTAKAAGIFTIAQRRELTTWFRSGGAEWPGAVEWPQLQDAQAVGRARDEMWSIYQDARRSDMASKELGPLPPPLAEVQAGGGLRPGALTIGSYTMPFVLIRKEGDEVPEEGRALFICMHGGGGNAQADGPHAWLVNSREWQAQASLAARLYAGEGIFFVPRMADDRRGRWHHAHNQDAFDMVIEHAIREWGVDPDRVYLMGISEGCYGTQILAPHMADRFGGACAMAGGIGESVPLENLRNLAIRTEVGENDTTFDRVGLARRYHDRLRELADNSGGYPNVIHIQPGRGHGIDYAPGPVWMVEHHRNARPDTVVWTAAPHDGNRRAAFYWLGLADRGLDGPVRMLARLEDGGVKLSAGPGEGGTFGDSRIQVMLDDGMVDLDAPLVIAVNGEARVFPPPGRSVEALARTLIARGDPKMSFPAVVELKP